MDLEQFIEKVYEIGKEKYPTEMLTKFIEYWTETNTNGRKMKWEYQKTFNIAGRLATWAKNDRTNFGRTEPGPQEPTKEPTTRKEILLKGLQMCCQAKDKPESYAMSKLEVYELTVDEIPTRWLLDAFKQAIKKTRFWPSPKDVIEAYKEVDFGPVNKAPQVKQGKPYLTTQDTDCLKSVLEGLYAAVANYLMECGLERTPHLPLEPAQARLFSKAWERKTATLIKKI